MRLEAGKYYKTRDGRKVGPMIKNLYGNMGDGNFTWWPDGSAAKGAVSPGDIVSEWVGKGPVRTVTKREIVPGVYGRVEVIEHDVCYGVHIGLVHKNCYMTAEELREAAHLFNQIAEVLEDASN